MNRFLRTAYSTTLVYLYLTLFVVTFSGVSMPFPAFSCLYFGLLVCLLPGILRKLEGLEVLFTLLGAVTAGISSDRPRALPRKPLGAASCRDRRGSGLSSDPQAQNDT